MAKLLKLRRGTTTQHASFTGAEGELTVDITKDTAVVHDGSTQAGRPLAREDMSNVSSANIAGQLGTDSIATTKIAAGALPTDVTVASANIVDGSIVNADVNTSAAIAGTKIAPDFGSQDITTTGKIKFANVYATTGNLPSASTYHGMFAHVHDTGAAYFAHNGSWWRLVNRDSSGGVDIPGNLDVGAGIDVTGNMTVTGTVDGRDVAADGTKLDGIESSATADQTAAEIRTLVESASDSNVFTDADHSKLNGIEASATADQTNAEIRAAVEAASDSNVFTDADHSKLNAIEASATADQTASEIVSLLSNQNIATTGTLGSGDLTITGTQPAINFVDSDNNPDYKVRNSNGGFIVTDTTNSVNRIIINTDGHIDIANNVDFAAGIDVTGNITATGTVDGRDVATDGTKLDGIEASATADQTGAEILSLISGSDVYTTGAIGRDNGDKLYFTDNTRLDLYINGSNEFRFESDGDFHADGDVYAFSTTVASDENLKKDIVTVADAVTKVEALKGVTFKWNKNDAESAGVIAQDVEKVLPQAVKTVADIDGNEYKAVNYSGLTSILIEAIKDLSARVKVLEAK